MVFQQLLDDLSLWLAPAGVSQQTPEFFELVKNLAVAKSRQAQSVVIEKQAELLKALIRKPDSHKRIYEYLTRAMYCEMLGAPVPECYIHVIWMAQKPKAADKRLGYACASLFLNGGHELQILLSNSVQKDLDSCKTLNSGLALGCYSSILDLDSFNGLLPYVEKNLKHGDPYVRKKVLTVLYSALKLSIEVWPNIEEMLQVGLADSDLSVVFAALASFEHAVRVVDDESRLSEELGELLRGVLMTSLSMVPFFLRLFRDILDKRVPRSYIYKLQPAPWIQIRLLKILARLGRADRSVLESVQTLLNRILTHTVSFSNAGSLTLSETVRAVCMIDARSELVEAAVRASMTLVVSPSSNFKYLGLTLLEELVRNHAESVAKYQAEIGGCLQGRDDLIRRKALVLLGRVCNEQNVDAVVRCMLAYLKDSLDWYTRFELVFEVIELTRAYSAGREEWAISTVIQALMLGGDAVLFETAKEQLELMMRGADRGGAWDARIVRARFERLVTNRSVELTPVLSKLAIWSLGGHGGCERMGEEKKNLDQIQEVFHSISQRLEAGNVCVRRWIAMLLLKFFVRVGEPLRDETKDFLNRNKNSSNTQLAWICQELLALQGREFERWGGRADASDGPAPSASLEDIAREIVEEGRREDRSERVMDGTRFLSRSFEASERKKKSEGAFEAKKKQQRLSAEEERDAKESVGRFSEETPVPGDGWPAESPDPGQFSRISKRRGHVWREDQF